MKPLDTSIAPATTLQGPTWVNKPTYKYNAIVLYDGEAHTANFSKKDLRAVIDGSQSFAELCDCNRLDIMTEPLPVYDEAFTKEKKFAQELQELPTRKDGSKAYMVQGKHDSLALVTQVGDKKTQVALNPKQVPVFDRDCDVPTEALPKLRKLLNPAPDR